MISLINCALFFVTAVTFSFITCSSELQPPYLALFSHSEPEYTDIIVRRMGDNLTLTCQLRGDDAARVYVWNYVAANGSKGDRPFDVTPLGPSTSSNLTKLDLRVSDSGHYMCSAPPFSVTKYVLVQTKGPSHCARGAFWCGTRCVLAAYVCDGRADCANDEDESPPLCHQPCDGADKLKCGDGRCVPRRACDACDPTRPLCNQPACCQRAASRDGFVDVEYPPLFEDRRAPDEYGFIQSTIYTVTACALIFMIAVVLLVSAVCKMHMKRAALRTYVPAQQYTAMTHRFPPCYEASRLLEQEREANSGVSETQCVNPATSVEAGSVEPEPLEECTNNAFGLARLSALLNNRYRQVPTQCCDVEMTDVRSTSLHSSPIRSPTRSPNRLDNYRSPTFCDLNADFYFTNPEANDCGRELNYMATPVEFYRRRTLRSNIERVDRPLTLQLGRFQLNIPRFGRRSSNERRPDTPNVAEVSIEDLDFVRFNSNETYTLNGRTIRLLGANFENYPGVDGNRPPPYNEAMRYKLYGPPPEYLSRDCLDRPNVDQQATSNIEMPPEYNELASGSDNANNNVTVDNGNSNNGNAINVTASNGNASNVIADNGNASNVTENNTSSDNASNINNDNANNTNVDNTNSCVGNNTNSPSTTIASNDNASNGNANNDNVTENNNNVVTETINSVIDNLPAIDSDLNCNDAGNVSCS